jgi:hypothetical protein
MWSFSELKKPRALHPSGTRWRALQRRLSPCVGQSSLHITSNLNHALELFSCCRMDHHKSLVPHLAPIKRQDLRFISTKQLAARLMQLTGLIYDRSC